MAGHRAHRFGASSETAEQLQLALETSEIAAAAMTARMKLPDVGENRQASAVGSLCSPMRRSRLA